jgi:hypothetical protein
MRSPAARFPVFPPGSAERRSGRDLGGRRSELSVCSPANWVEIVAVALALRACDHGNLCLVLGWATTRGIRDRLCVSVFLHSTRRAARRPGADWSCSLWALEA